MAEFVEFRSEEMIPELEQLEKLRIFDKNEIRIIAKKRRNFEYKIQRRSKCKEDYIRYIQYEMDLLKLVRSRRMKVGLNQKKSDVDVAVANRINKLFKQAIFRFQDDLCLWLSYIKFCKQVKLVSCDRSVMVRMLRVHGQRPSLWKLAATWEFEENKSIENARQFLLRGLRTHPDSKILFTEAFRLELVYADLKHKQKESKDAEVTQQSVTESENEAKASTSVVSSTVPSSTHIVSGSGNQNQESAVIPVESSSRTGDDGLDQVLEGRLAEVMYESATKRIHDESFTIGLLSIAKNYKFTEKLQSKLVGDLLTQFSESELTWDAMARRELEGLSYSSEPPSAEVVPTSGDPVQGREENKTKTGNKSKNNLKERIRRCSVVYQFGLERVPTERMWSMYLETLLEINQDLAHLPNFKKKLLGCAFQNAHNKGLMQEKYYVQWVYLNSGKRDTLSMVLRVATERFPVSVDLWQMRLQFHLSGGDEQAGTSVFKSAVAVLGNDNAAILPLWKMLIEYWQTKSISNVEQVFRDGMRQGPNISSILKPMFLEWLVLSKDISDAREEYQSLSSQPPLCLELHQKMAVLECVQPDIDLERVRKCYELACEQFGSNSTDIWIEYVKFEQKRGDPKKVTEIHWRALKTLNEDLADNFVSEFCLVNTGLSKTLNPL